MDERVRGASCRALGLLHLHFFLGWPFLSFTSLYRHIAGRSVPRIVQQG